jgi:molybdopterin-guanine dinucleotide biosynthesis protein A
VPGDRMKHPCSGIILAGGLNSRFSGQNKAFIEIEGKTVLSRIETVFREFFDERILVTNDPLQYLDWDLTLITDLFPARSSLTGIHAGLFSAIHPYAFVTACDTPFIRKELVQLLVSEIDPRYDVIIPETPSGLEPLLAVYSKQCLHAAARNLERGRYKIQSIFKSLRIRKIPAAVLMQADPELISFFNINTAQDLAEAEERIRRNHAKSFPTDG